MTPAELAVAIGLPVRHLAALDPKADYSHLEPRRDERNRTKIPIWVKFTNPPTEEQYLASMFLVGKVVNTIGHQPHQHDDLLVQGYGYLWQLLNSPCFHESDEPEAYLYDSLKNNLTAYVISLGIAWASLEKRFRSEKPIVHEFDETRHDTTENEYDVTRDEKIRLSEAIDRVARSTSAASEMLNRVESEVSDLKDLMDDFNLTPNEVVDKVKEHRKRINDRERAATTRASQSHHQ